MLKPNSKKEPTFEQVREIIADALISKGVAPPAPGSPKELEMCQKWLEGYRKLNKQES